MNRYRRLLGGCVAAALLAACNTTLPALSTEPAAVDFPMESRSVVYAKLCILDALADSAVISLEREGTVDGHDCLVYTAYLKMTQDDGTRENVAYRLAGHYAIAADGSRIYRYSDGSDNWELWLPG